MKTFTVTVAYYDTWNEQTLVVEAHSIDEACTKAIAIADDERVEHYRARSWDPGVTFVAGITEGGDAGDNHEGDALDNIIGGTIPFEHSEEAAAFGACVLRDALKAALPELESELEQRRYSGNGETVEPLRTIVTQVRNALGGSGPWTDYLREKSGSGFVPEPVLGPVVGRTRGQRDD